MQLANHHVHIRALPSSTPSFAIAIRSQALAILHMPRAHSRRPIRHNHVAKLADSQGGFVQINQISAKLDAASHGSVAPSDFELLNPKQH
jgi:hypothetical protein